MYGLLEDAIYPEIVQASGFSVPIDATRDQLLARRVMSVQGHLVTVPDPDELSRERAATRVSRARW